MTDPALALPPETSHEKSFCPPVARKFVMLSAIFASSMGFIDGSVVAIAIPAIRADLGASLADAQWINNAYLLLLSSLVLTGGAAGDVFGVRNIFGAGVAIFIVTSLLCALAPDDGVLIAMRAAQGFGAALMVPGSLAIIAKSYPSGIRGRAIGTWAAFSSITTAMGPIIGSLVLSYGNDWMWRLIFAINFPIGLVVLAMLFGKVPRDSSGRQRKLDLPGTALATAGLGSIAWGLTGFGLDAEFRLVHPTFWLALGFVISVIFLYWERRAAEPMVKLELFRSKAFSGANLFTLILFIAFIAILFFLPMTLITGWGTIEWQASLVFAPLSIFIGGFSRISGQFADRYGPRNLLAFGALCVGVSYLALAATMPLMQLWTVTFPIMCLNGVGMAMLVSPLSTAVMQAAPDEDAGLASGINNAIARSAGLIAVAAFGAMASILYTKFLGQQLAGPGFGAPAPEMLDAALLERHVVAMNRAFQFVALTCAAICLIAAIVAWRTQPWRPRS